MSWFYSGLQYFVSSKKHLFLCFSMGWLSSCNCTPVIHLFTGTGTCSEIFGNWCILLIVIRLLTVCAFVAAFACWLWFCQYSVSTVFWECYSVMMLIRKEILVCVGCCVCMCMHAYMHACVCVCVCVCVCACVSEIVFSCTVGDCQVKLQLRCSRHALTFRKVAERFPFLPLMLISLCWCFLMWLHQFTTVQRLGALPQN